MAHPMLLTTDESVLVIVDIQEKLLPAVTGGDEVVANAVRLIRAAGLLGMPVLVTEQYPRGLGPTVGPIREALDAVRADGAPVRTIEKTTFACTGEDAFLDALEDLAREQIVLAGVEAHICVLQTALDLVEEGAIPFVVGDAVGSRVVRNRDLALDRLRQAGVVIPATESVLFEWVGDARHPRFKSVLGLVE